MKQVRRWLPTVIAVTHTDTHPHTDSAAWSIKLAVCGGLQGAYLCAYVYIFQLVTNAGEIQMSQNDQCPVQRLRGDNLRPLH